MLTIHLSNLRFYASHGLYDEEKITGAEYEVNVMVSHRPATLPVLNISETIDYTAVYELVKAHMQQPRQLLETVATTLTKDIFEQFAAAESVCVDIKKIHPPVTGFQGSVGVSFASKRYNLM